MYNSFEVIEIYKNMILKYGGMKIDLSLECDFKRFEKLYKECNFESNRLTLLNMERLNTGNYLYLFEDMYWTSFVHFRNSNLEYKTITINELESIIFEFFDRIIKKNILTVSDLKTGDILYCNTIFDSGIRFEVGSIGKIKRIARYAGLIVEFEDGFQINQDHLKYFEKMKDEIPMSFIKPKKNIKVDDSIKW